VAVWQGPSGLLFRFLLTSISIAQLGCLAIGRKDPMPVFLGAVVASAAVYLYVGAPLLLLPVWKWIPTGMDTYYPLAAAQLLLVALLVIALRVPLRSLARPTLPSKGLRAMQWLLLGGLLVSLLVSVTVVSTSDAQAVGFTVSNGMESMLRDFEHTGLAGALLRRTVFAPALEELLFRVLVIGWLLRSARPWLALAISTALFGATHGSWLVASFLGLGYGLLYLRYRSFPLCVLTHGLHNLVVALGAPLLVAYLHEANLLSFVGGSLLALQAAWLAVALACFGMFFYLVLADSAAGAKMSLFQSPTAADPAVNS
jgi:membrane protease YdiL (CAAX protease family)